MVPNPNLQFTNASYKSLSNDFCLNFRIRFVIYRVFFSFFISGVTVTLSTLIDGKNFQAGGHKVGLALELEA